MAAAAAGGRSSSGCRDQSPQRLGAPPGGQAASSENRHRLADCELRRPVAGLEEVNEPGRCFLGSVLGNPVAGWARGSPRECGPAPPPLNAGGVRGSCRGGGSGGRGCRSGESMPPALRFAQAALAARAPMAQDETRLHDARLGSQPDAVGPAASALVPGGHARPLQAVGGEKQRDNPRHHLSSSA